MGNRKQQMEGYLRCQGTDRGVLEIRDGKFYDGEPGWFPGARTPDGFYWFDLTEIKNGRLYGPHPSLLEAAAAAASAVVSNTNMCLQDIELALKALEARGELESRVRPNGVPQYWLSEDAADTGIGPPGCKPRVRG